MYSSVRSQLKFFCSSRRFPGVMTQKRTLLGDKCRTTFSSFCCSNTGSWSANQRKAKVENSWISDPLRHSLRLQWRPAADQGTGYKYMEEHVVLTENHLLEDSFEEHSSTTVWRQKCPKSTGRTQHHWVCHVLFYLWPMTWHSLVPRGLLCDEWWERFWVFIRSSEESKSGWD